MKNIIINKNILFTIMLVGLLSCDRDEGFEREQYKNVFALISGTDNVFTRFHDLRENESIGYLSASCGGTNPTQNDIIATIVEDSSLVDNYNKLSFDVEYDKYAHHLSKSKYSINSSQLIIPSGETGATLPINIRPEGLSPDSVYLIPLKVDAHDNYEVNSEKSYVLYRVRIKNFYARDSEGTTYNLIGNQNGVNIFGTKIMHPLGANKVRVMAGAETFKSDIKVLEKLAIVIEVDENNNLKISPYSNLQVTQVDGDSDYPNIFKIEFDGYRYYKTFLLRYDYTYNNQTIQISEEMRYNFNPKDEDEL